MLSGVIVLYYYSCDKSFITDLYISITMDNMNFASLLYLFFRFAPFLIVGFMTMGSVINGQIRGFIYLVGLCFSMVCTYLVMSFGTAETGGSLLCRNFSLNGMVNNKVPLGLAIISHTFFYLVYTIAKYRLEVYNLPVLIIFPVLIIAEIFWNLQNGCFRVSQCICALILAGGLGVVYSVIIDELKMPKLQFLAAGSTREVCNMPQKQKFRCVTTTTG